LIQQWLKDVVIATIENGHIHRRPVECPGGSQPGKPTSDDQHARERSMWRREIGHAS
jgi:hypothetical protein